jgi:hypothetical protein
MVEKMRLRKSAVSACGHNDHPEMVELPVFDAPPAEHWPSRMSWSDAMRAFAPYRDYYMRRFDSPERRLQARNPEPFKLV